MMSWKWQKKARERGPAMAFSFLEHTADVAVRFCARDPEELFRDGALAIQRILLDMDVGAPPQPRERLAVRLEAEDAESLLVDYLNEIIFLFDARRFLVAEVRFGTLSLGSPALLDAAFVGEALDPRRHVTKTEIKAATFHGIEIRRTGAGVETEVVFDL